VDINEYDEKRKRFIDYICKKEGIISDNACLKEKIPFFWFFKFGRCEDFLYKYSKQNFMLHFKLLRVDSELRWQEWKRDQKLDVLA